MTLRKICIVPFCFVSRNGWFLFDVECRCSILAISNSCNSSGKKCMLLQGNRTLNPETFISQSITLYHSMMKRHNFYSPKNDKILKSLYNIMKHVNRKNWIVNISSFCFTTVQQNKIIHRYVLGFCPMVLLVSCSFVSCAEHSCIVKKSHIF